MKDQMLCVSMTSACVEITGKATVRYSLSSDAGSIWLFAFGEDHISRKESMTAFGHSSKAARENGEGRAP